MLSVRQTDDLELVYQLDRQVFTHDRGLSSDDLAHTMWWVAELDGEPVGYAGLQLQNDAGDPQQPWSKGYFIRAGVLPQARGAGLQKRFVRVRCAAARRLGLPRVYTYVWVGNIPSMRSLVRQGFLPYYAEKPAEQTWLYLERILRLDVRTVAELPSAHALPLQPQS